MAHPAQDLHVDPDITRAATIPARVYHDSAIYEACKERVFARSWQFIGDAGLVKVPGQVHPFTLLEGCLNEPVVLTRTTQDTLYCLSNVCTHRANLVCEAGGIERFLRCRYHGRRFGLDGTFQHMPEFEGAVGFPSSADHLPRLPFGSWGPWLFAGLRPRETLEAWLGPIRGRLAWLPLERFGFDAARSRDYLVRCNWALYCENYLEGFHIPFVHASLNDVLDYGSYATELFPTGSLQIGVAKGGEESFDTVPEAAASPDRGGRIAAYYYWFFPNLMLNFYPWGLSINVVRPLGPEQTRVSFLSYVWESSRLEAGAGAALDRVEREDESIVEAVQRGVRSRLYERGRYSPTREQGVHHFHRMLAAALLDG